MIYPKNPKVTFRAQFHGHEISGTAVNPGKNFGKVYVLEIGCGYSSFYYAIEADNESEAVDEFTDSEFGHLVTIEESDLADYNLDDVHHAGNCGIPVNLDDVRVYGQNQLVNLRYHAPFLSDDYNAPYDYDACGVTPDEYSDMNSNGDLDLVWGQELCLTSNNENPSRYVELRFPIPCPNAKDHNGTPKQLVQGSLVQYKFESDDELRIGRAFGILTRTGMGEATSEVTICVMELSSRMQSCYVRTIGLSTIESVTSPSEFTRWFFSADFSDTQSILSLAHYGSLSDSYLGKYLGANGNIRTIRPAFHYSAIEAASRGKSELATE